jgi:SOUL heme-binding protein
MKHGSIQIWIQLDQPQFESVKMSPTRKSFFAAVIAPALLALTLLQGCAVFARIEEPPFESLKKEADVELRQYRGFIVAETWVKGDMSQAGNDGFRAIADYIFGNNIAAGKGREKIAMTAPVTMEKTVEKTVEKTTEKTNEKIAMTAPVTMEKNAGDTWRVHFVMPSQYTMATLPKPVNPNVKLREVAGQKMAVIRFSGFSTDEKVNSKTEELTRWIMKEGLKAIGAAQFARYDPPLTPPFMRRSEVMIPVE